MKSLLLLSSSRVHGSGYLDYAADDLRSHLAAVSRVLFVPFAMHDLAAYAGRVRDRFRGLGLEVDSVHDAADPRRAVERSEAIFVGGGNTFRLLAALQRTRLLGPIRERVLAGAPYVGSSAGTNLACPTIMTTNDMPIVEVDGLSALGLVPFQINPHYFDADPASTHQGETREQRIAEFLEENDAVVVGLREGAVLAVRGERVELRGTAGARVFRRGEGPRELLNLDLIKLG
jgi:dipeptidase E